MTTYKKRIKHKKSMNGGHTKYSEKIVDERTGCVILITSCDPKAKIKIYSGEKIK